MVTRARAERNHDGDEASDNYCIQYESEEGTEGPFEEENDNEGYAPRHDQKNGFLF